MNERKDSSIISSDEAAEELVERYERGLVQVVREELADRSIRRARSTLSKQKFENKLDDFLSRYGTKHLDKGLRNRLYAIAVRALEIFRIWNEFEQQTRKRGGKAKELAISRRYVRSMATRIRSLSTREAVSENTVLCESLSDSVRWRLRNIASELSAAEAYMERLQAVMSSNRMEIESHILLMIDGWITEAVKNSKSEKDREKLRAAVACAIHLLPEPHPDADFAHTVTERIRRARQSNPDAKVYALSLQLLATIKGAL